MVSELNNILQVFRRWNLNEDSTISEDELVQVLEKVGKISREQATAFFAQVDVDSDRCINYADIEAWLLSSDVLPGSGLLNKCKCPDGHSLVAFKPEVDGWYCEECGEDLEPSQQVLRCLGCDGICWCLRCMVQQAEVAAIEKAILTSVRSSKKRVARATASSGVSQAQTTQVTRDDIEEDDDEDGMEDQAPLKRQHRTRSSLNFLNESKEATPAEEQYIEELVRQFKRKCIPSRLEALEELASLLKEHRLAATVVSHIKVLIQQLGAKEDTTVQLEILSLLRRLAELEQADVIAAHAYAFVQCLSNKDMVVARKASMLFCTLAREGSGALLTRCIPNLLECFERTDYKITAPVEALQAIADSGESKAVASAASRLRPLVLSLNSRGRGAVCKLVAAIFRGEGGDIIYGTLIKCSMESLSESDPDEGGSLLRSLLVIVRDDEEEETRLLAAQALQSIVLYNEETVGILRKQHALLMFNCLGSLRSQSNRENREACNIISEILGLDLSELDGDKNKGNQEDEDGPELCSVCFTHGLLCQRGGPLALPCGHKFHAHCIADWFAYETKCGRGRTCPLCRSIDLGDISKEVLTKQKSGSRNVERQNSVARLRAAVSAARAQT